MLTQAQSNLDFQTRAPLKPLVRELPADLETPVSTYLKLAGSGPSFLLESVTGGEQVARYSFIGVHPSQAFVLRGEQVEVHTLNGLSPERSVGVEIRTAPDSLAALEAELARRPVETLPGMPRFAGGLAGYLNYEMMRFFEPSVALRPHASLPDAIFLLADTLVAFDHAFGRLLLIANPDPDLPAEAAQAAAEARLDALQARLSGPLPRSAEAPPPPKIRRRALLRDARQYDPRPIHRRSGRRQRVHRRRGYLPGGAFTAPQPADQRPAVRYLPHPAPAQPLPLHVLFRFRYPGWR